jgi:hypothetical protein
MSARQKLYRTARLGQLVLFVPTSITVSPFCERRDVNPRLGRATGRLTPRHSPPSTMQTAVRTLSQLFILPDFAIYAQLSQSIYCYGTWGHHVELINPNTQSLLSVRVIGSRKLE